MKLVLHGAHWLKLYLDDVELETSLQIRAHDLSWSSIHTETLGKPLSPSPPSFPDANHGFTRDNRIACCVRNSSGLVDCQGCLDGETDRLTDYLDEAEKAFVLEIGSLLNDAGQRGIGKKDISVSIGAVRSGQGSDAVYF